jgi:hypothetical protein
MEYLTFNEVVEVKERVKDVHKPREVCRLPEIYFNSKENPNGRIFLFQKIFRQMWKTVNLLKFNRLDLPFPDKN